MTEPGTTSVASAPVAPSASIQSVPVPPPASALPSIAAALSPLKAALRELSTVAERGRVTEVLGTLVRATGIQVQVGELCELRSRQHPTLRAEVVGFRANSAILTPFGDIAGLSNETEVIATNRRFSVHTGPGLLGRVLDGFGNPMDGLGPLTGGRPALVDADPPPPLVRRPIDKVCQTGIRVVDSLLTVGQGQRVAIVAPVGVGKTTLMGMLARGTRADVNVVALIGERGREVVEFVERTLGPEGLKRSVVVVTTSDRSAVERAKCAQVATAIAEGFRREGQHVLLLVDSVTRYARALREIGLASGEAPTRRGFPPSVYAALPRLLERAGNDDRGTITAFYTLLLEGDEESDPIAEEVRSLLDGHLQLSKTQAQAGQFPAIDVLGSLSRVMPAITPAEQQKASFKVRGWLAKYRDIELLLQMGEYQKGSDGEADEAIAHMPRLKKFLHQPPDEFTATAAANEALLRLVGGAANG
jgi:type III secretion protein N (ATPase)